MRRRSLVIALAVLAAASSAASADPGDPGYLGDLGHPGDRPGPFRRTTPRGWLDRDAGGLVVGIPGGRAWGIESDLRPLDGATSLTLSLAVDDPDVAEAFVRIAFYGRADARSRQLETRDSPYVRVGEDRRITVTLDPPAGAVAFRVRVLGRLVPRAVTSRRDAIRARWPLEAGERDLLRPSPTRLETDLP